MYLKIFFKHGETCMFEKRFNKNSGEKQSPKRSIDEWGDFFEVYPEGPGWCSFDIIFVCHFVDADLGVEIFFEKEGAIE